MGLVEFAGPQDFCGVNVGAVVDPFVVNVVVWFVADDDEVFTRFVRKMVLYGGPTSISLACLGNRVTLMAHWIRDGFDEEQKDGGAREPAAEREGGDCYGAKMTDGLHQQDDDYAGEWRGIVCE